MEEFSTIITAIGAAKLAATLGGAQLVLAQIAVGDSNGAYYEPSEGQTNLVNETWRGPVITIANDPSDATRQIVTAYIPPNVGGFTIREAGLFTNEDPPQLFAVAKIPAREKVDPITGSAVAIYLKLYLDVDAARIEVVLGSGEDGTTSSNVYLDTGGSGKQFVPSYEWRGVNEADGENIWVLKGVTIE